MSARYELEGAACAEISPQVVDHFFEAPGRDRIRLKAARNICGRCVVLDVCRRETINGRHEEFGFFAGMTKHERDTARAWHNYELGLRDTPPSSPRPEWLWTTDAVDTAVEAGLIEDADELYGTVL